MHPRVQLVLGGVLTSIQFGDVVALCARGGVCHISHEKWLTHIPHPDSDYRDRLELKSTTDRTLGVGVIESEGTLLILTAATMMKAIIDVENVIAFDPQYDPSLVTRSSDLICCRHGQAKLIKSTMMQAIMYGALPEVRIRYGVHNPTSPKWAFRLQNPLHFSFPPELDEESLMRGAEQLSQAVLESGLLISSSFNLVLETETQIRRWYARITTSLLS